MNETREVRQMRLGLFVIGWHFLIPAFSYALSPHTTVATVQRVNVLLGGAPWTEGGHLWNMLAFGNVATLGMMCLLLRADIVRFLPVLPALAFLKLCSAFLSLAIAISRDVPVFYAVFALDFSTTIVMVVLAMRAAWSVAADRSAPWWARWILPNPEVIERGLEAVARVGLVSRVPNLWQVLLGALAMWHRIVFRSSTVGTSREAVRNTWRARVLAVRAIRLPFLLAGRSIAPLDTSGLASSRERVIHHVLSAHHDDAQIAYDLELLTLHEGGVEELRTRAHSVVTGVHTRAAWLKDLCVFEGYHQGVVAACDAFLRGTYIDERMRADPDLTFTGTLRWCAAQPASFPETWAALRAGRIRLRFA